MSAALTRRERRVKRILLKELERMNEWKRLTYAEKQHLEKSFDVEWIDRELAKMRKAMRRVRMGQWILGPVAVIALGASLVTLLMGDFDTNVSVSFPVQAVAWFIATVAGYRSIQRKMFIYEALRELSDAEELDVQLSKAALEADALIERIVTREMEIEARFPVRTAAMVWKN